MACASYWLLSNFEEQNLEECLKVKVVPYNSIREVYDCYRDYCQVKPLTVTGFGRYVASLFPETTVIRRTLDYKANYYTGLQRIRAKSSTLKDAVYVLKDEYNFVLVKSEFLNKSVHMLLPKLTASRTVYMNVFITGGSVRITCDDVDLNLCELPFPDDIDMDYIGIMTLGKFVSKLKLCEGIEFGKTTTIVGGVVTENVGGKRYMRSIKCKKVLQVIGCRLSCTKCREAASYCNKLKVCSPTVDSKKKKTHRTEIEISRQKKKIKYSPHSFQDYTNDQSTNKRQSHHFWSGYLETNKLFFNSKMFTKANLEELFEQYNIIYHSGVSKLILATELGIAILSSPGIISHHEPKSEQPASSSMSERKGQSKGKGTKRTNQSLDNICRICEGDYKGDYIEETWIECDQCHRWLHWQCSGLEKKEVDEMTKKDTYVCHDCKIE